MANIAKIDSTNLKKLKTKNIVALSDEELDKVTGGVLFKDGICKSCGGVTSIFLWPLYDWPDGDNWPCILLSGCSNTLCSNSPIYGKDDVAERFEQYMKEHG